MKKLNQTASHRVFTQLSVDKDGFKAKALKAFNESGGAEIWYITFAEDAIIKGMHSYYVNQDLAAAKQWFYVAAKCIAISTTKPVGFEKFWALHPFMFALLSDNTEIITRFSTIETANLLERRDGFKNNEFDIYLVQIALQGDYTKLAELVNAYKDKSYKQQTKFKLAIIQFMEGLMSGNISEMESAIALHGEWQLSNPTTEDFLSDYGVVLCKLAWLRGYQVQLDSPLVPMAFMPIAPLAHYDDVYDFLKPDWVAPPAPSPEEQEEINRKRHEEAKKANLELVKKINENNKPTSFLDRLFGK